MVKCAIILYAYIFFILDFQKAMSFICFFPHLWFLLPSPCSLQVYCGFIRNSLWFRGKKNKRERERGWRGKKQTSSWLAAHSMGPTALFERVAPAFCFLKLSPLYPSAPTMPSFFLTGLREAVCTPPNPLFSFLLFKENLSLF